MKTPKEREAPEASEGVAAGHKAAAPQLQVGRVGSVGELPDRYGELFGVARDRSVFISRDWFENYEHGVLAAEGAARVYTVDDARADRPVAVLPMQGGVGASSLLRPAELASMSNYYTPCFSPVLDPFIDLETLADALVRGLSEDRRTWDVLTLRPLLKDSDFYAHIVCALRRAGHPTQEYFCFGNWYVDVANASYAEYMRSRSKKLRKNVSNLTRRLEKLDSRVEIISAGGERFEAALNDFEIVYNSSWRDNPEPYPDFIPGLARRAVENGWLRLGLIYVDQQPAAAQLWLVRDGVASIFKICYQKQFEGLSVGTILTAKLLEHVIDVDGVSTVDFLSGDDPHKKRWMTHRQEFWGLSAFNLRRPKGLLEALRNFGGRSLKRAVRQLWSRSDG